MNRVNQELISLIIVLLFNGVSCLGFVCFYMLILLRSSLANNSILPCIHSIECPGSEHIQHMIFVLSRHLNIPTASTQ